jgi:DNA helicase TIP49 (TBP-interacting protein)
MNTLQNVYNKLSDKTELAKHEVELSLKDDLMKATTILEAEQKKSMQFQRDIAVALSNLKQTKKALLNQLNGLDTPINNVLEISNILESKAKELGISPGDVVRIAKNKVEDAKIGRNASIKTYELNNI